MARRDCIAKRTFQHKNLFTNYLHVKIKHEYKVYWSCFGFEYFPQLLFQFLQTKRLRICANFATIWVATFTYLINNYVVRYVAY